MTARTWVDGPTGGTPLNAAALNGMESDIASAVSSAAASATSAANSANLVGAPADTAIATAIQGIGTLTAAALNAAYGRRGGTVFSQYAYSPVPLAAVSPTVTVTNDSNAVTTMTNAPGINGVSYTSIDPKGPLFTALGVGEIAATSGGAGAYATTAASWTSGMSAGYPLVVVFDFLFDGLEFEMCLHQGSAQYRIKVDGSYLTAFPQDLGGTSNAYGNIKVTFTTATVRHITVEFVGSPGQWLGLWKHPTDTILPTGKPARRLLVIGDSYGGGNAYSSAIGTFVNYLGQGLGFFDIVNSCIGSTGWLANGSYTNIATRLQTDVIAQKPTDIIITLGHNDTAFTPAQITTQVQSVISSIRTGLPNLRSLTVTGPLFTGAQVTLYTPINTAISAGSGAADAFIDTITVPIFTGTGKTGSRPVTDAATTASSTTVTSATAAFSTADVGVLVTGAGIPSLATISSVTNATTAILSAAATATATGVALTITNQKNDGNGDKYIGVDGTHPTDPGAAWLGYTLAQRIAAAYK